MDQAVQKPMLDPVFIVGVATCTIISPSFYISMSKYAKYEVEKYSIEQAEMEEP